MKIVVANNYFLEGLYLMGQKSGPVVDTQIEAREIGRVGGIVVQVCYSWFVSMSRDLPA